MPVENNTTAPIYSFLSGTGSFLPAQRLSNADLEKRVETTTEWIETRTGILERRIAGPDESSGTLALEAARRALDDAKMVASDLDLIICASITPEMMFPSTACFVQAGLGCRHIGAFDLLAACSGFVYALSVGGELIRGGRYRNVLVIGSETLSRITDYADRSTCILFGDGAGAAILSASENPRRGLKYHRLYADGSNPELMSLPAGGSRRPATAATVEAGLHYMKMEGKSVYKFAVSRMQVLIREAMEACSLSVDDVALIIPHQVNQRIIDSAMNHLGIPMDKVMTNLRYYGNTSAASIPIALDEARRKGLVREGSNIITVAFGGGLTWGTAVLTL